MIAQIGYGHLFRMKDNTDYWTLIVHQQRYLICESDLWSWSYRTTRWFLIVSISFVIKSYRSTGSLIISISLILGLICCIRCGVIYVGSDKSGLFCGISRQSNGNHISIGSPCPLKVVHSLHSEEKIRVGFPLTINISR